MLMWSLLDVDADEEEDNKGDGVENFRFTGDNRFADVVRGVIFIAVGVDIFLVGTSKSLRNLLTVKVGVIGIEAIGVMVVFVEIFEVVLLVIGVEKMLFLAVLLVLFKAKLSKHILACLTLIGMFSSSLVSTDEDQRPLFIRFCFGVFVWIDSMGLKYKLN